jgi:hypothetical protein
MRTFSILSAAALTAAALGPALGTAASATSCVPIGKNTPHAWVTGTEPQEDGSPTYLAADGVYAVVGTVTAVDTDASNQYGVTEVSVDVDAVFGTPPDPDADLSTVTVTESDPGLMNGYLFERGTRYFIPLQYEGPGGLTNYSFVCDPIAPVEEPQPLVDAARVAGVVDVHEPGKDKLASSQQTGTEQEGSAAVPSGDSNGFPLGPVALGLVGMMVAGALPVWWLRTARYRHAHGAGPA